MLGDLQTILDVLSKSKRVLVTTHVRPDGDALGSTSAMVAGMRSKGVEAEVLLLSHLPTKYSFIYEELGVKHTDVEKGWPADFSLNDFDTLLVVDTGTWSQLPGMKERVAEFAGLKLVVDHHLTQEDWADHKLVVTQAGAAGEIVAELLKQWGVKITPLIAKALFSGNCGGYGVVSVFEYPATDDAAGGDADGSGRGYGSALPVDLSERAA